MSNLIENLFITYSKFHENTISTKYLPYQKIEKLIYKHSKSGVFEYSIIGKSTENVDINMFKYGTGITKVLIWSQMHGDETTGTQAVFDIFNLLSSENENTKLLSIIKSECTLYFIPMLNPDGALKHKRRNSCDVDINRDARAVQSPEAKILAEIVNTIKPDFGFNLHDQEIYYSAGNTAKPATISFLTPSFNFEKSINESRISSMKLIVEMNKVLQNYIPGCIGRYNDDFMPNAFGDIIQKSGTATILIESGGYKDDDEKQFVRKLNYISILSGLISISDKSYIDNSISDYGKIPFNKKNAFFDIIYRNVKIDKNGNELSIDVGLRKKTILNNQSLTFEYQYFIDDIGDLSDYFAYEELQECPIPRDLIFLGSFIENYSIIK